MKNVILSFTLFLFWSASAISQDTTTMVNSTQIINGDTVALIDIRPVFIYPPTVFKTKRETVRWDRLVYNVKIVYPYAKLAGQKLKQYKAILDTIPTEKARKLFIKTKQTCNTTRSFCFLFV